MQFCSLFSYPNHLVILLVAMVCFLFVLKCYWGKFNLNQCYWTTVVFGVEPFPSFLAFKNDGFDFCKQSLSCLIEWRHWLTSSWRAVFWRHIFRLTQIALNFGQVSAKITLYHLMEKPKNRVEWRWVCSQGKELQGTQRRFSTVRVAPGGY